VTSAARHYDVTVVGGGIHGVGVLQAAAAAGHSALLVEERAIASGTSSRSSKLVHGGLRYLETGALRLVRESLRERAILCRIAPDLVRLVPFYIPIYGSTRRRPWQIRVGLSAYALLAGAKRDARFSTVPRARWGDLDGLDTRGLEIVFRYFDGQTDDAALANAVLRSARSLGAEVAMPARFVGATRTADGYRVRIASGDAEREHATSALVNAAGPWIESVRQRIDPTPRGMEVELVGGAHVELEGTIERGIYYTEAPHDARAVFIMPWKGRTLVGTTETPFSGDPRTLTATQDEIAYLCGTLARYFPGRSTRVVDAWAGLRVLPRGDVSAFARTRETALVVDDPQTPRLVGVYGGKLTAYRSTAHKVMRLLERTLPRRPRKADTATLRLEPERALELALVPPRSRA
jgi:glycerol-3-phosphate dehydrogenase